MTIPLYTPAQGSWESTSANDGANLGLVFDKFFPGWNAPFDKVDEGEKLKWVKRFAGAGAARLTCSADVVRRHDALIQRLGGMVWHAVATSRFVTGTEIANPLENGFAFHHSLGVPYLQGSGFKGAIRAYWDVWHEPGSALAARLFGTPVDGSGSVIFFDMLPVANVRFTAEVMTPHGGDWYQDPTVAPGDWHSPIPIPYLTVEAGAVFRIAAAPRVSGDIGWAGHCATLRDVIKDALEFTGLGAKTGIGSGRFELFDDAKAATTRATSITADLSRTYISPVVSPTQGSQSQRLVQARRAGNLAATFKSGDTLPEGTDLTWAAVDCRVRTSSETVLGPSSYVDVVLLDDEGRPTDEEETLSVSEFLELRHIK